MDEYDYLVVGAGFAGCVIAERLASQLGKKVLIIDKRDHIGGNCYDYIDNNGILIQEYGPHIFHTNNKRVFDYISQFIEFNNYKHKVLAFYNGDYYPIPINLDTINKFFNASLKNEQELKSFLEKKRVKLDEIKNSKDVVVSKFGEELYNAFINDYTKKQWDRFPEELDKSVLERLPIKYDKDEYYFKDLYQGMPIGGFTKLFQNMLSNAKITVKLNSDFFKIKSSIKYKKLIFTGMIDEFFSYKFGKLKYRGLNFVFKKLNKESFQPNSVINFSENKYRFSRITEFKKFYDIKCKNTVICTEFFTWGGEPCYPLMDLDNIQLAKQYMMESEKIKDVYFIGRLAQNRYFSIDQVILEALKLFDSVAIE